VLGIITGMVAGLGTITPASGFVGPSGAVVIGATAGLMCFLATQFVKRKLHIDDSLDVSPVHGVGGAIGTVLTGVFVSAQFGGVGFAQGMDTARQVGVQLLGVAATAAWCGALTWIVLKLVDALVGLRVAEEQESEGLDLALHGERAYSE
jgi:Amt family ammonium transporter